MLDVIGIIFKKVKLYIIRKCNILCNVTVTLTLRQIFLYLKWSNTHIDRYRTGSS